MIRPAIVAALGLGGVLFAGAAIAQTPASAPTNIAPTNIAPTNAAPTFQYNPAAVRHEVAIGDSYTAALNALYSQGYHAVRHLWMKNGMVEATAVSPNGTQGTVAVNPETNQISTS